MQIFIRKFIKPYSFTRFVAYIFDTDATAFCREVQTPAQSRFMLEHYSSYRTVKSIKAIRSDRTSAPRRWRYQAPLLLAIPSGEACGMEG